MGFCSNRFKAELFNVATHKLTHKLKLAPPLIAELAPPLIAELAQPLIAELAPPLIAELAQPLIAELAPPLIAELAPPLIAELAPPLIAELAPPLIAVDPGSMAVSDAARFTLPAVDYSKAPVASRRNDVITYQRQRNVI